MAEYDFRLPDVKVTVKTNPGQAGFEATVIDAGGGVLATAQDHTEPGAIGLAILAAKDAFAICDGCGQRFRKDDMGQTVMADYYCVECAWDQEIVKAPAWW